MQLDSETRSWLDRQLAQEVARRHRVVDAVRRDWGPMSFRTKALLVLPMLVPLALALPWSRWLKVEDSEWIGWLARSVGPFCIFSVLASWYVAWGAMRRVEAITDVLERSGTLDRYIGDAVKSVGREALVDARPTA